MDHVLEEDFLETLWTVPGAKAANKMAPQPRRALGVLQDLYSEGLARHVPKEQINGVDVPRCVRLDDWRTACRERGLSAESDGDPTKKAAAEKKAFERAVQTIEGASLIGMHGSEVWLIAQQRSTATGSEAPTWHK